MGSTICESCSTSLGDYYRALEDEWGKLRLKIENKFNIPKCLTANVTLLTLTRFIIAAELRSLQNHGIYLLLLVHSAWPFIQLITWSEYWGVIGQALHRLCEVIHPWRNKEAKYPRVLSGIVLFLFVTPLAACRQLFFRSPRKTVMLPWRLNCPMMSCVITASLLGFYYHWHITRLVSGLI